jgi:hypothetical protein
VDVFLDLADLADGIEAVAVFRCPVDSPWRRVNRERLVHGNGGRWIAWATGKALLPAAPGKPGADGVPKWAHQDLVGEGEAPIPVEAEGEEAARSQAHQQAKAGAYWDLWQKIRGFRLDTGKTLAELAGNPGNPEEGRLKDLHDCMYRFATVTKGFLDKGVVRVRVQIPLERVWELVKDWK